MLMLALVQEKYHYKGSVGRAAHKKMERRNEVKAGRRVRKLRGLCSVETCVADGPGALFVLIPPACLLG